MVQLQEYYQLGESTGPYAYIPSHQEPSSISSSWRRFTRLALDESGTTTSELRRVARLHSTNEEYINLFSFDAAADLIGHLGTSKYLMSPFKGGYENGQYWRREVMFRRGLRFEV